MRFVEYKRHTFVIQLAKRMDLPILIMGSGPQRTEIQNLAEDIGVEFMLLVSPDRHTWLNGLANAKAMIFPGIEDFGITPIEAIGLGTPVFALGKGGALDYIQNGVNGQLIERNDVESYREAILNFSSSKDDIRYSVAKFSTYNFKKSFQNWVSESGCINER